MGIIYTIAEVTETLDKAISCIEEWNYNRHLNNSIVLQEHEKVISVRKGIREMADVLGIKLQYEKIEDHKWYSFNYKGYIVSQFDGDDYVQ